MCALLCEVLVGRHLALQEVCHIQPEKLGILHIVQHTGGILNSGEGTLSVGSFVRGEPKGLTEVWVKVTRCW